VKARWLVAAMLLAAACARNAPPPVTGSSPPTATAPATPPAAMTAVPPVAAAPSTPLTPPAATAAPPPGAKAVSCDAAHPVDFERDVQPIMKRRCFSCHTNGGIAVDEHDFSSVKSIQGARLEIGDEIASRSMPPNHPLPESEADVMVRWATCVQAQASR
jgi:hypothetical protein